MKVFDDRRGDGMELAAAADAVEAGVSKLEGGRFFPLLNRQGSAVGHLVAG